MYETGTGVPGNLVKAFEYYAASDTELQRIDGSDGIWIRYRDGKALNHTRAEQKSRFEAAANAGSPIAKYHLAQFYLNEKERKADSGKAVTLLEEAAFAGYSKAEFMLGTLYRDGKHVQKSDSLAVQWLTAAAEQGHSGAQNDLGNAYSAGVGVLKDFGKAAELYKKAAAQGRKEAQYNLARSYLKGNGVPRDVVLAYAYLNLSAAAGIKDGESIRNSLEGALKPLEISEAQRLSRNWKPGTVLEREVWKVTKIWPI